MIRELFHLGPLSVSPFGVLMAIAFLAGWAQLRWGFKRLRIGDEEDASALLLAGGIGGIVGAKVYYAAKAYFDPNVVEPFFRVLFSRSGLVWYGGLILATVAILWVIRRRRLPPWRTTDALAPSVALGYAIGRVGCFLVGDDYGMPTEGPWGVAFPYGLPGPTTAGFMRAEYGAAVPADIPAGELIKVHPTQLYETLAALAIWLVAVQVLRRGAPAGSATLVVLGLLAAERFAVEFLRAKDDRFLGGFTVAQLISVLVLLVLGALWLWRRARSPEPGRGSPA